MIAAGSSAMTGSGRGLGGSGTYWDLGEIASSQLEVEMERSAAANIDKPPTALPLLTSRWEEGAPGNSATLSVVSCWDDTGASACSVKP